LKKLLFTLLIQGYIMGATLLHIDYEGIKIPIIYEKTEKLPLRVVELVFKNSGYIADTKAGVASMSAALLGEGTKSEGALKFATDLDNHAITLNAGNGRETFVITLEALDSEFDFGLKKLTELLDEPNYTKEAFEKIQKQRLGVLMSKRSDYDYIASTNLHKILFKGTPLAHPSLGDEESIKSMKLDDIREFISSHLHLDNLIVEIGGNMSEDEVKEIVSKILPHLPKGEVSPLKHYRANENQAKEVVYKDTDQAYIYFGSPYYMRPNSKEKVLGKVAVFALGSSGFGSRMMEEIRVKRGLAYSAYARFSVNKSISYLAGYLQTKLESQDEAIKEVKKIVDNFVAEGITQDELDSAKKFYLGSEPLRTETLSQRLNRAFHEYYNGTGIGWSKKELEMIKNLTLDEVNSFIKSHKEISKLSWSIVTKK